MRNVALSSLAGCVLAVACGDSSPEPVAGLEPGTTAAASTNTISGVASTSSSSSVGDGTGTAGPTGGPGGPKLDVGAPETGTGPGGCAPPEVLVLLDRSAGMGRTVANQWPPAGAWETSKLWVALEAAQMLVAAHEDEVRFGLALFPGDRGEDICSPIDDPCWQNSGNTCQTGKSTYCVDPQAEMSIDFGLGQGDAFSAIDPLMLEVCAGTPTASGVALARTMLDPLADSRHEQAVVLITDGSSHCGDLVAEVHSLAAETDVALYVIGFTDDVMADWVSLLNDAACAARTAPDFPDGCVMEGAGWVAENPNGEPLFYPVADPEAFAAALESITTSLGCVEG